MKKGIVVFLFLVSIFTAVYVVIPAQLLLSETEVMKANPNALFRYLSDESKWAKWWPSEIAQQKSSEVITAPQFDGYSYRLTKKLYNAVDVDIVIKNEIMPGKIAIIPITDDSLIVHWNSTLAATINPFLRFSRYYQSRNIKRNMADILDSLKSFAENKDKVYKNSIRHTTLTDTFFVAIKTFIDSYPSTELVYKYIHDLRKYIASEKAKEVNYPILNITKKDSSHYQLMVAIPTNIALAGKENISFKRMIVYKDKILTTVVKGGPENIKKAYDEIHLYMNDYNLISPVIPWETLITDRSKEKDSTKWVTRICVPIV